jgi:hypothetical protein
LLHLRVTAQAQVWIWLDQHLAIDRTVRLMTGRASFAHGLVFKDKPPRLLAMAGGALLVQPRHGKTTRGLHNVGPMRIVALNAMHLPFEHWMMLRQAELGVDIEVTGEARLRFAPRIDDEPWPAQSHMLASRPVA